MTEIIKLNIGGKIIQTKKSTLCQSKFFNTLLNDYDISDEVFIDDDPDLFIHLLNKLRNAKYKFPNDLTKNLTTMANFYQIPIISTEQKIKTYERYFKRSPFQTNGTKYHLDINFGRCIKMGTINMEDNLRENSTLFKDPVILFKRNTKIVYTFKPCISYSTHELSYLDQLINRELGNINKYKYDEMNIVINYCSRQIYLSYNYTITTYS